MSPIEMTKRPIEGYSGTRHFGVPEDSGLQVVTMRANQYRDDREFVSVEFTDYGLDFIFDREDVPEAWKSKPDFMLLRNQAVDAICKYMTPRAFGDILTAVRWSRVRARDDGAEDVRASFRSLLGL